MALVLANTVQLQDWDGRYSRRNKEWAKTIPNDNPETVRCGYVLNKMCIRDRYDAVRRPTPQRTSYDPAAPVYAVGDTVYIEKIGRAHV